MKQLPLCLLTWFRVSIERRHQSQEEVRANQNCQECVYWWRGKRWDRIGKEQMEASDYKGKLNKITYSSPYC